MFKGTRIVLCSVVFLLVFVSGCAVFHVKPNKSECLNLECGRPFIVAYPTKALPVEKTAAEELADYIEKAVGMKSTALPESKLSSPNGANAYVGRCEATKKMKLGLKLPREAYDVCVSNGKLYIVGDDEKCLPFRGNKRTGTLFGVYDFLENVVGITWIWPGETGECVPKSSGFLVPPFKKREAPKLMYRVLKFSTAYPESKTFKHKLSRWLKRMRLSNTTKTWYGHSWGLYVDEKTRREHPEWLALWNGKRQKPQYCTSNKGFRDFIVKQCLENRRNKGCSVVSISPNDGFGFCECAKCRALDPPGTDYSKSVPNLSNRHWAYAAYIAREVAKRNPDLGVGMLAYTAYQQPPTNIKKFPPNLYTQLCYSQNYFIKPKLKKKFISNLKIWGEKGLKFTMYEYWGMHYWMDLPYIITKELKESMPVLYKAGLSGLKSEAAKNFATQGPNYYLGAHLMWDPEMDGEAVLKKFYAAFGPASGYVRKYYETFENSLRENQGKLKSFAYLELINSWPELFPRKTLDEAGEWLKKARGAVAGNPELEKRLKIVEIGYDYTKTMVELLGLYRTLGRAGVPLWTFGKAGIKSEFNFWNKKTGMSAMPKAWVDFIAKHPDIPIDRAEKLRLLKRAFELGEKREKMLERYAELPSMSIGMYKYMKRRGYYQWHETIKSELKKMESGKKGDEK